MDVLADKELTDPEGGLWRLRGAGQGLSRKAVVKLLEDPEVLVLLHDGEDARWVAPSRRAAFREYADDRLPGWTPTDLPSDNFDLAFSKYKDDQHRHLLYVEARC